jgi:hypothetical protein
VEPASSFGIVADWRIEAEPQRGHADLLESAKEDEFHVRLGAATTERFDDQFCAGVAKRQVLRQSEESRPSGFLEDEQTAWPDERCQQTKHRHRVGLKLKNQPANYGIEGCVSSKLCKIHFQETDVLKARDCRARSRFGQGDRIAVDADDLTSWANEAGDKECHVTDSRSDVKDALPRPNAGVAKEALGERREASGLAREALMFCIRTSEHISGRWQRCGSPNQEREIS